MNLRTNDSILAEFSVNKSVIMYPFVDLATAIQKIRLPFQPIKSQFFC